MRESLADKFDTMVKNCKVLGNRHRLHMHMKCQTLANACGPPKLRAYNDTVSSILLSLQNDHHSLVNDFWSTTLSRAKYRGSQVMLQTPRAMC